MNPARQRRILPGRALIFAGLLGYSLWVIFPMVWMAYSSLKPDEEIFRQPFALPAAGHLQFDNYSRAWRDTHFGNYFFNSVLVTSVSVAAILLLGAMAGYALSRFYHPAGRMIFWLFLAGLTIPGLANAHSHAFHRALRGRTHAEGARGPLGGVRGGW